MYRSDITNKLDTKFFCVKVIYIYHVLHYRNSDSLFKTVLSLQNTGAYEEVIASNYNLQQKANE